MAQVVYICVSQRESDTELTSLFLFVTMAAGLCCLDQLLHSLVAQRCQVWRRLFSQSTDLGRRDQRKHVLNTCHCLWPELTPERFVRSFHWLHAHTPSIIFSSLHLLHYCNLSVLSFYLTLRMIMKIYYSCYFFVFLHRLISAMCLKCSPSAQMRVLNHECH